MLSFVLCRDAHGEPGFTGEPRLSLVDGTHPDLQVILVSLFFLNSETCIGTLDYILYQKSYVTVIFVSLNIGRIGLRGGVL